MIKLVKIFDILGMESRIIIYEGEKKLYSGTCENCTRNVWKNAHIVEMKFNNLLEKYIISIRYM